MRPETWRRVGTLLGVLVLLLVVHRVYQYRGDLLLLPARMAWPVVLSFVLFALAQLAFALSWHRLARDHAASAGMRTDLSRWCATVAGKYLPGKVWQGLARAGLYHRAGKSAGVLSAYLRETMLAVSAAMSIVALHGLLGERAPALLAWPMLAGAAALILLATPMAARWASRVAGRLGLLREPLHGGTGAGQVAAWLLQLSGQLVLGLGFLALCVGVAGLPVSLGLTAVSALSFAGVAGIAAFIVPAGLGVREAALAWYLAPVIGPGPAALLAIAARIWLTLGDLAVVALGLWLLHRRAPGQDLSTP